MLFNFWPFKKKKIKNPRLQVLNSRGAVIDLDLYNFLRTYFQRLDFQDTEIVAGEFKILLDGREVERKAKVQAL